MAATLQRLSKAWSGSALEQTLLAALAVLGIQAAAYLVFLNTPIDPPLLRLYDKASGLVTINIILALLGYSALLACAAVLLAGSRLLRRVLYLLLLLQGLAFMIDANYLANFGVYPSPYVLREFLSAPSAFTDYTKAGVHLGNLLIAGATLVFLYVYSRQIAALARAVGRPRRRCAQLLSVSIAAALGSNHLWGACRPGELSLARERSFSFLRWMTVSSLEQRADLDTMRDFLPVTPAELPPVEKPQHVLIIVNDCWRADHLPHYGYPRDTTPYLSRHAAEWITYPNFYSQTPDTIASAKSLISGRYHFPRAEHGLLRNAARRVWRAIDAAGYRAAYISSSATDWGAIEHWLSLGEADYYFSASLPELHNDTYQLSGNMLDYAVRDELTVDQYGRFLAGLAPGQGSVTVVHLMGSHFPYAIDESYKRRFVGAGDLPEPQAARGKKKFFIYRSSIRISGGKQMLMRDVYDGSMTYVDAMIARLVGLLREKGDLDRSLIMLTGDHGDSFGEHDTLFHGTTLYNEQVKVPLLVRVGSALPRLEKELRASRTRLSGTVDLMPTALSLLGASKRWDGLPLYSRTEKPYEVLVYEGLGRGAAFVTPQRKYIFDLKSGEAFEFDLENDPGETHNLIGGRVEDMAAFIRLAMQHQPKQPRRRSARRQSGHEASKP